MILDSHQKLLSHIISLFFIALPPYFRTDFREGLLFWYHWDLINWSNHVTKSFISDNDSAAALATMLNKYLSHFCFLPQLPISISLSSLVRLIIIMTAYLYIRKKKKRERKETRSQTSHSKLCGVETKIMALPPKILILYDKDRIRTGAHECTGSRNSRPAP